MCYLIDEEEEEEKWIWFLYWSDVGCSCISVARMFTQILLTLSKTWFFCLFKKKKTKERNRNFENSNFWFIIYFGFNLQRSHICHQSSRRCWRSRRRRRKCCLASPSKSWADLPLDCCRRRALASIRCWFDTVYQSLVSESSQPTGCCSRSLAKKIWFKYKYKYKWIRLKFLFFFFIFNYSTTTETVRTWQIVDTFRVVLALNAIGFQALHVSSVAQRCRLNSHVTCQIVGTVAVLHARLGVLTLVEAILSRAVVEETGRASANLVLTTDTVGTVLKIQTALAQNSLTRVGSIALRARIAGQTSLTIAVGLARLILAAQAFQLAVMRLLVVGWLGTVAAAFAFNAAELIGAILAVGARFANVQLARAFQRANCGANTSGTLQITFAFATKRNLGETVLHISVVVVFGLI